MEASKRWFQGSSYGDDLNEMILKIIYIDHPLDHLKRGTLIWSQRSCVQNFEFSKFTCNPVTLFYCHKTYADMWLKIVIGQQISTNLRFFSIIFFFCRGAYYSLHMFLGFKWCIVHHFEILKKWKKKYIFVFH